MRSKTITKFLTMFLTCTLFLGCSGAAAFAYGNGEESTEQISGSSTEDDIGTAADADKGSDADTASDGESRWKDDYEKGTDDEKTSCRGGGSLARDEDSLDVEWSIIEKHDPDGNGILTPVGNLTLADDLDEEEAENLQYMTVKTKSGNVFYLIVDRSGNEDNVYFLNMVDESDLMALMDEETQEKFREAASSGSSAKEEDESADTVLFSSRAQEEPADEDADKADAEGKNQTGNNPFVMLLIFVIIGAGVAGGYYFFKIKPQKEQPAVDEDMEFYDDEDYVDEDTASEDQKAGNQEEGQDSGDGAEDGGTPEEDDYYPGVNDFSDESIE